MTYDEFNVYCSSFKATCHVVQWGGSHAWKVGDKVFAIGGWADENNPGFTFKVSDLNYDLLHERPGFRPAPYLASRGMKWIQQCEFSETLNDELKHYISESYRIVSLGLTKKKQKELGLNQD